MADLRTDDEPGRVTGDHGLRCRYRFALTVLIQTLAAVIAIGAAGRAWAAGDAPVLTQYAHTTWRVKDGELDGAASDVTQTRDGYLWVATASGLEFYDGVKFRHWKLPTEQPVFGILASRDGSLWVSQDRRIFRLHSGVADVLTDGRGRYNGLYQDRAGAVWVARSRGTDASGALCRVGQPPFRCFGPADGQPCLYGSAVSQDASGGYWIGSDQGACQWRPDHAKVATTPAPEGMRSLSGVLAFAPEPDGTMLAGFTRSGRHLGLQRITSSGARAFMADGLNGETLAVKSLLRDREGTLWIGTAHGLYHVVDRRADHFGRADGLSGDNVNALYEDREGNVWAATTGGVDKFRRQPVTAITSREGLSAEQVSAVVARRDGSIWIGFGYGGGLDILRKSAVSHIGAPEGLPGRVTSMLEDTSGQLWVGVDNDLTRFDGKSFQLVRKPDGSKLGVMVGLAEGQTHDVWVLTAGRPYKLYRVRRGQYLEEVRLPLNARPAAIASGSDGAIWIADEGSNLYVYRDGSVATIAGPAHATAGRHLAVLSGGEAVLTSWTGARYWARGRWTLLDTSRGMPCNGMGAIVLDARGLIWFRAQCGLIVIARSELSRLAEHPRAVARLRLLDGADGAQPGFATFKPAAAASPDGRLWFATDGPLLTVGPDSLSSNTLPPPVHIERIIADHRSYRPGNDIRLPALTRDVEIDYAGLSFVAPQKVRFRYRLIGVDAAWQNVETRRAAFYMNLKPGHYGFQVIASNNDGLWSPTGDSVAFSIEPAFYQTIWFRGLAVLLLLALAALAVRLRVRTVTREIETRLSARQAERIRIARELHDTLLQGFQGLLVRFQVVADAIPEGQAAKPMMEAVLDRADEILVEGRDRVRDLRSEEDGGSPLLKSLESIAFALEREGCAPIEVRSSGSPRLLDAETQHEFVAIAREAMTNACKHAEASAISCHLTFTASRVLLVVEDDGAGIDKAVLRAGGRPGHWGLTGMRERARQIGAALSVGRAANGTRVELTLNMRLAYLRRMARRLALVRAL